jgi:hypothetical protein
MMASPGRCSVGGNSSHLAHRPPVEAVETAEALTAHALEFLSDLLTNKKANGAGPTRSPRNRAALLRPDLWTATGFQKKKVI